jgi:O-antigen ligase
MNEKKGFLFSERHEMHFITAYRMFLEKKFFGHGIKTFRYLCDQEPYSTKDLLINNNRFYAPIDGYYYLKNNFIGNNTYIYYVLESQKFEFEKISKTLEDALILKNDNKIREAEKDFYLFEKNNLITSQKISYTILDSIQSSSKVSKGDYVLSNSEFTNGCNTHPHNIHLQILSELGLFGYLFLFVFFIYLIFIFLKNFMSIILKKVQNIERNYNLYKIFIILALIQNLFPIIPSGNIFNNWLSVLFYFQLAFLLNFVHFNKKS